MAQWIYFLHPRREDFAATMTGAEAEIFVRHLEHLKGLLAQEVLILAGPTLGRVNTGLAIFEAEDEEAARALMESDPAIREGVVDGELREMRVSLVRGG